MKFFKWFALTLLVLIIVYFFGPKPSHPKYTKELPAIPADDFNWKIYLSKGET